MTRRFAFVAAICGAVAAALVMAGSAFAAFPGTNGRVAYAQFPGPGTNEDIFAVDANGQNRVLLAGGPDDEEDPSYSADGEKIAFARFDTGGNGSIWVMNQDGTGQTRITTGTATSSDSAPVYSPDATKLAFTRFDGSEDQIWIMNADGTGQTQLTFEGAAGNHAHDPSYSPDGTKIAFSRFDATAGSHQIAVISPDGAGLTGLTTPSATSDPFEPDWAPDGQRIAFDDIEGTGNRHQGHERERDRPDAVDDRPERLQPRRSRRTGPGWPSRVTTRASRSRTSPPSTQPASIRTRRCSRRTRPR